MKPTTVLGALLLAVFFACERAERAAPAAPQVRASPESSSQDLVIIQPMSITIGPANVSGCYAASWTPANPFPSFRALNTLPLPKRFELEAAPRSAIAPRSGTIVNRLGQVHYRSARWEIENDRLRMGWSTGFVGIEASVALPASEGLLSGDARTFSDDGSAKETATIRLQRIAC